MQARLKKTVVLVGMMGAGKTAVGKALATMLHAPFLDSDAEIEKAANMTIPEIFARDGEPFFRVKERQVISRLIEREKGVLSTGGGAYMAEENREIISKRVSRSGSMPIWTSCGSACATRTQGRCCGGLTRSERSSGSMRNAFLSMPWRT